jgi:Tfp pilus assembly protein FimT
MSLLELLAGVAIVSAAVVFAAPSLIKARENYELEAVARHVATRLQWARLRAITGNHDCRVRVVSAVAVIVECENPIWQTRDTLTLPRGFVVTATASPRFQPRGNVAPTATLTVRNAASKTKRVVVNITGRVRLE